MLLGERPALEFDLRESLVQASCKLLSAVKTVLRPSLMPGRTHYLFTLKDIVTCFQVTPEYVTHNLFFIYLLHFIGF